MKSAIENGMNRTGLRLLAAALLLLLAAQSFADGTVELTAFPGITVSDGRSTITVSAQIRDSSGQLVPDGTRVLFETTLGRFRESIVATQNGFARAVLVASSTPGNAKVRATILKFNATTALNVQFVADRSLLDSRKDYIEIVAPQFMAYSLEHKILEASGDEQSKIQIRYRDIVIEASDVQIKVPYYEIRAKNATLTIGEVTTHLTELYMRLNTRTGVGIVETEHEVYRYDRSWILTVPRLETVERDSTVTITNGVVSEAEVGRAIGLTVFEDISEALTIIKAKRAIAYPSREVHFYDTQVLIGGQKIMSLPLFRASTTPQSPIITEQYFNVYNNDFTLNYPHFVQMQPGQVQLFRLVHNRQYGAGAGAGGGTHLNYEFNWNRGYEMDGGLTVTSLLRNDWGLRLRQFWKPSRSTTLSGQIDFPAHRSMFANVNLSQDFDGFYSSINASDGRNISGAGTRFRSSLYSMIVEKDPIKLGGSASLRLGMTASQTRFTTPTNEITQNRTGFRARVLTRPMIVAPGHYINMSYTVNRYLGGGLSSNISQQASMSLASSFKNGVRLQTGYDFIADGITEMALGQHRLSASAYFNQGAFTIRGFTSKSLDVQRLNASLNFDYRVSSLWRFNYGLYSDQYIGDSYFDQTFVLAYRLGFREIGISYSHRRKRLGLEILGTTFN